MGFIGVDVCHVNQEHMLILMEKLNVTIVLLGNIHHTQDSWNVVHVAHPLVQLVTILIAGFQMLGVVLHVPVELIRAQVVHDAHFAMKYHVQLAHTFIVDLRILQVVFHAQQAHTHLIHPCNALPACQEHTLQRDPRHASIAWQGHIH